jgi:hypothetical protein
VLPAVHKRRAFHFFFEWNKASIYTNTQIFFSHRAFSFTTTPLLTHHTPRSHNFFSCLSHITSSTKPYHKFLHKGDYSFAYIPVSTRFQTHIFTNSTLLWLHATVDAPETSVPFPLPHISLQDATLPEKTLPPTTFHLSIILQLQIPQKTIASL